MEVKHAWVLEQTECDIVNGKSDFRFTTIMLFSSRKKALEHLEFRCERLIRANYQLIIDHNEAICNGKAVDISYLTKYDENDNGSTFDLVVSRKNIY